MSCRMINRIKPFHIHSMDIKDSLDRNINEEIKITLDMKISDIIYFPIKWKANIADIILIEMKKHQ